MAPILLVQILSVEEMSGGVMLRGRKYRLDLSPEQLEQCEMFGNVCRAVWNVALEQRREYRRRGSWMNYVPQAAELAEAKQDHAWLTAAPSHILQQALRDLDRACREHGTYRVHWRSKARWDPSFRFPAGNLIAVERLSRRWARAKLPKLGWVRFRFTRPLGGQVRSATVSRKHGHWYVSFLVEDGAVTPERHCGGAIGVDRGVIQAATTSAGEFRNREFITRGERTRYRRLQQRLARCKRGSVNRRKVLASMGRIINRVTDRRADFCAWTASRWTSRYALVVLEDLRTKSMTASASGTIAVPGAQVTQKAGLNRAILDKGWHRLELAIRNAARRTGTQVVLVRAAYTSQMCYRCKHVNPKNRKSQAVFQCTACGHRDHADVNAARNILNAAGHAVSACGDLGAGRSVKQEPAGTREEVPSQSAPSLAGVPLSRRGEEVNSGVMRGSAK